MRLVQIAVVGGKQRAEHRAAGHFDHCVKPEIRHPSAAVEKNTHERCARGRKAGIAKQIGDDLCLQIGRVERVVAEAQIREAEECLILRLGEARLQAVDVQAERQLVSSASPARGEARIALQAKGDVAECLAIEGDVGWDVNRRSWKQLDVIARRIRAAATRVRRLPASPQRNAG